MNQKLLLILSCCFVLSGCCAGKLPFLPFCAEETVGQVLDASTGAPIRNAQVTLSAHMAEFMAEGRQIERTVRTDGEGRFRLRHPGVAGLRLFVVAEGYHVRSVERGYFSTEVELFRPGFPDPEEGQD